MNLSIFAERLSTLLFEARINARKLGLDIGCGDATIYKYLSGRYAPSLDMLIKLANYFNCTTDFILGLENENYAQKFYEVPPFGRRFIKVLEEHGYSRYKITRLTGISESVMRYWVKGKTRPSVENLVRITAVLGCTFDYLIGRTN